MAWRNNFIFYSAVLIYTTLLAGCLQANEKINYLHALHAEIKQHAAYSQIQLTPSFHKAGLHYPPNYLTLIVYKQQHILELWARDDLHKPWRFVKHYSVLGESGKLGPKLHSGDQQVPEGIYQISYLNPQSHYDLSLELNYPNAFDRQCAEQDHRQNLGDDIFIHGSNRSVGCIAIGDLAINELFPLVYFVGRKHITVIIAPYDLRERQPILSQHRPIWLPKLYQQIKHALVPFRSYGNHQQQLG